MMNKTVKIGIGFALAWCVIKYILFLVDPMMKIQPMVMLNILFLLLSIAIGMYVSKRSETEDTNLLLDMKTGLKSGIPYAVIVGAFMYLYYAKINPEYTEKLVADKVYEMKQKLDDPAFLAEFRKANPKYEVKTKEEIFEEARQTPSNTLTPGFTSSVSTLSLVVLSIFYSLMVAIVYRRIVFRQ